MSAQGRWALLCVRDAICPIVRVHAAAASCDKSQRCLQLLFLFISLILLQAVQYIPRMSPVASMMAETLPPPPPLRFMYPEAGEWKREILDEAEKEDGGGERERESAVGRGEGLDRNSRAVSAKDKHISPTKQRVSVSISCYTQRTGIKPASYGFIHISWLRCVTWFVSAWVKKTKTNKVWGAQWRTGLGVKGWRVLRISSRQNGKLYVTSVGLYAQCSKHTTYIFCRLTIWEHQAHEVKLLYLKIYLGITLTIFAKPDAQAGARACEGVIEMMMVMMVRCWHGRRGEIIQFDFLHQEWARHGSHTVAQMHQKSFTSAADKKKPWWKPSRMKSSV